MSVKAQNPILPGFYPDPSICAVGGDYYIVNSTFAYFPGLPILHSRDLAHWEQAGNAMNRASQLPLQNAKHSAGLFAPTIRYFDGTFYIICTNVSHEGNYIVTASDPAGPWSEPYYIEGAEGIDPSLFFDEDGTCYYIGTHPNPKGCKYGGDWYIWVQQLDIANMKLVGEKKDVWNGAMRDIIWPEAPHLYKKDGYYYILHAEGGTGPHHAVTVCRSRNVFGPYENNFCNPIFSHRHLGKNYPIKYVGHADMIETPAGEWYMVMLAVRPLEGYTTMGRETFLARVEWEDGWPVVNPGVGILTDEQEINLPKWDSQADPDSFTNRSRKNGSMMKNCYPGSSRRYDFAAMKELGDEFLLLRNPPENMYTLEAGKGLKLHFGSHTLKEAASPSYIGVRQQHHYFSASAGLSRRGLSTKQRAGMALLQSNEYHLRVEADDREVLVILCERGEDRIISRAALNSPLWETGSNMEIILEVRGLSANVSLGNGESEQNVAKDIDIRSLSTEVAGGFVGCTVGIYAVCREGSDEFAEFTYFKYQERTKK